MSNPIDSLNNYWNLSIDIWKFNDIQSQLKEWWEILKSVKEKAWKNSEIYKKFEKEYNDLYENIKKAFESEKEFSKEERTKIMLELWDIIKMAQENNIIEKKWVVSKVWDLFRRTNTENEKQKTIDFLEKDFDKYSQEEAIAAIDYLSWKYSSYKKVDWNFDKVASKFWNYSNINQIDDRYEAKLAQEKLIKKVLWNDNFWNGYIKWFNNEEKWNYIMKITDFEDYLKNPSTIIYSKNKTSNLVNSNMLANYFLYLESNWNANITYLKSILSSVKLTQLKDSLENNPNSIVKKILKDDLTNQFIKNIDDSKIVINKENYKERLTLDPKRILFINDKNILLEAINNIPNLKYKDINNEFKYDIEIIESFIKKDKNFNINQIPTNFYKIDVKNKDDLKKIKILLNIVDKKDTLSIIWELSIYLNPNQITEFLKSLDKNNKLENDFLNTINWYNESYKQVSQDNISKINKIDVNNITKKDLDLLNIYIYKFWIIWIEEKITQLIIKWKINWKIINISDIPSLKKILNKDINFTKELIKKAPSIFENLNDESRNNYELVDIYLDSEFKKWYLDKVNAIENINFWENIRHILIIYYKLNWNSYEIKKENQEKIKSIFKHPAVSQKFFRFFEQYWNNEEVKLQINYLKWIKDIFWSIEKDFESSKQDLINIQNNFNKEKNNFNLNHKEHKEHKEKTEFEEAYWDKINQVFSWLDIKIDKNTTKQILELINHKDTTWANQDLVSLIRRLTKWNDKKLNDIFKWLQNIKIEIKKEEIKKEEEKQTKKLEEAWLSKEDIEKTNKKIKDNVLENIKNIKKNKKESKEEYIEKILELSLVWIDEKIITKLDKESLKKIIENNIEIEETTLILKDTKTYFKYLETWDFTKPYSEYKAEVDTQTLVANDANISYTESVLNNITNNWSWNYIYKSSSWNIDLSLKEVELISTNEKAKENLENFMQVLNNLWLSNLSKYRQDIFQSISNKYVVEFNSNDDFINKTELKLFLNVILSSLWYEVNSSLNLEETITKVKDFNNLWLISRQREIDKAWNSNLEKQFLDKFDQKRSGKIEINKFEENIWDILK